MASWVKSALELQCFVTDQTKTGTVRDASQTAPEQFAAWEQQVAFNEAALEEALELETAASKQVVAARERLQHSQKQLSELSELFELNAPSQGRAPPRTKHFLRLARIGIAAAQKLEEASKEASRQRDKIDAQQQDLVKAHAVTTTLKSLVQARNDEARRREDKIQELQAKITEQEELVYKVDALEDRCDELMDESRDNLAIQNFLKKQRDEKATIIERHDNFEHESLVNRMKDDVRREKRYRMLRLRIDLALKVLDEQLQSNTPSLEHIQEAVDNLKDDEHVKRVLELDPRLNRHIEREAGRDAEERRKQQTHALIRIGMNRNIEGMDSTATANAASTGSRPLPASLRGKRMRT